MDLDVPKQLGNDCPFIIKFYGAIDAEVIFFQENQFNSSGKLFHSIHLVIFLDL